MLIECDVSDQRDYVGLDLREDRLLFFAAEADLEETLTVRKSLLQRYSVNDSMVSWSVGEISERTKAVNHLLLKP